MKALIFAGLLFPVMVICSIVWAGMSDDGVDMSPVERPLDRIEHKLEPLFDH